MIELDTLKAWYREGKEFIAVHYSSESIVAVKDAPTAVSAVAVHNLRDSSTNVFSRADAREGADDREREIGLLEDFFAYLRRQDDATYVHWNMNRAEYGFDALRKRYNWLVSSTPGKPNSSKAPRARFAKTPSPRDRGPATHEPVSPSSAFSLDDLLHQKYGDDYAPHPQLQTSAVLNGVDTQSFRDGKKEAELFEQGDWQTISRSTAAKARIIASLFERAVTGQIRTANSAGTTQFGDRSLDAVNAVLTVANRYSEVLHRLAKRRTGRKALVPVDEYDDQYLIEGILALFFDDVRVEQYIPSYANSSTRIDFLLPEHGLGVELKHTRGSIKMPNLANELIVDKARYATYNGITHLIALVFDFDKRLRNPKGLERDLSQKRSDANITVTVRIVNK